MEETVGASLDHGVPCALSTLLPHHSPDLLSLPNRSGEYLRLHQPNGRGQLRVCVLQDPQACLGVGQETSGGPRGTEQARGALRHGVPGRVHRSLQLQHVHALTPSLPPSQQGREGGRRGHHAVDLQATNQGPRQEGEVGWHVDTALLPFSSGVAVVCVKGVVEEESNTQDNMEEMKCS